MSFRGGEPMISCFLCYTERFEVYIVMPMWPKGPPEQNGWWDASLDARYHVHDVSVDHWRGDMGNWRQGRIRGKRREMESLKQFHGLFPLQDRDRLEKLLILKQSWRKYKPEINEGLSIHRDCNSLQPNQYNQHQWNPSLQIVALVRAYRWPNHRGWVILVRARVSWMRQRG